MRTPISLSVGTEVTSPRDGMPTLASYGLSEEDAQRLARRAKRVDLHLSKIWLLIGFAVGMFWGLLNERKFGMMVFDGAVGLLLACYPFPAVEALVEWVVKKMDPRVERYAQFRAATRAFEAVLKEAEERQRRQQAAFWQSLPGHRFEQE